MNVKATLHCKEIASRWIFVSVEKKSQTKSTSVDCLLVVVDLTIPNRYQDVTILDTKLEDSRNRVIKSLYCKDQNTVHHKMLSKRKNEVQNKTLTRRIKSSAQTQSNLTSGILEQDEIVQDKARQGLYRQEWGTQVKPYQGQVDNHTGRV